jgi:hypothetical protein
MEIFSSCADPARFMAAVCAATGERRNSMHKGSRTWIFYLSTLPEWINALFTRETIEPGMKPQPRR